MWALWARCEHCQNLVEKPSFGDLWFTKLNYPICPYCGEYAEYEKVIAKVHWWTGKVLEIKNA